MTDLTILQVTGNKLDPAAVSKINSHLKNLLGDTYPIISVSQKPLDLGQNIVMGEIGYNKYNEYLQVLTGARQVKTKYVATIDDDTLYSLEHFAFRPPVGVFAYETNYWFCQPEREYFWRIHEVEKRGGMWSCIVDTQTLVNNLTQRFAKYPTNPWIENPRAKILWGEPGLADRQFGMRNSFMRFSSVKPCVVFVHPESMGFNQLRKFYRRYGFPLEEDRAYNLDQFGTAPDLYQTYFAK